MAPRKSPKKGKKSEDAEIDRILKEAGSKVSVPGPQYAVYIFAAGLVSLSCTALATLFGIDLMNDAQFITYTVAFTGVILTKAYADSSSSKVDAALRKGDARNKETMALLRQEKDLASIFSLNFVYVLVFSLSTFYCVRHSADGIMDAGHKRYAVCTVTAALASLLAGKYH